GYRVFALAGMFTASALLTAGLAAFTGMPLIMVLLVSAIVRIPLMPVLTLVLMETKGVGARRMGSAAGLFFAASEIGGFGGPFLMGILRDTTGDLTTGVYAVAAFVGALLVLLLFLREDSKDATAAERG
ncbi:MAG: MFS transporter, partial [Dehalococcoidia bacterium]